MPVDWFTVVAQILNFLILVWLLKRFLYGPILKALDAREARIAATVADAKKLKTEAEAEKHTYQSKIQKFEAERDARMKETSLHARKEHERLLEESKQTIEQHRLRLEKSLNDEVEQLHDMIRLKTQNAVFSIARTVLRHLANESLETQVVAVFLERIPSMESSEKDAFAHALKISNEVRVRSAFEIPDESNHQIAEALKTQFDLVPELEFHVVPELISGIELTSHGQKLSWSIDDYLNTLVQQVDLIGIPKKVDAA